MILYILLYIDPLYRFQFLKKKVFCGIKTKELNPRIDRQQHYSGIRKADVKTSEDAQKVQLDNDK